jgi:hypothetical protein
MRLYPTLIFELFLWGANNIPQNPVNLNSRLSRFPKDLSAFGINKSAQRKTCQLFGKTYLLFKNTRLFNLRHVCFSQKHVCFVLNLTTFSKNVFVLGKASTLFCKTSQHFQETSRGFIYAYLLLL